MSERDEECDDDVGEPQALHVHLHIGDLRISVVHTADVGLSALLQSIKDQGVSIMGTQDELVAALSALNDSNTAVGAEVDKIGTETQTLQKQVADLTAAIAAGGNTTPAVDTALSAVQASAASLASRVKTVDDLVPDPVAVP